jgi:ketosteroid isomerase-like protein
VHVKDNLDIANRLEASVFAGDFDTVRAIIHPDFEMHQARRIPYHAEYKGYDGFMRFIENFMGYYDIATLDRTATYFADDGTIVVEYHMVATARSTGEKVDTTMLEKWQFKDGKVIGVTPHYFD